MSLPITTTSCNRRWIQLQNGLYANIFWGDNLNFLENGRIILCKFLIPSFHCMFQVIIFMEIFYPIGSMMQWIMLVGLIIRYSHNTFAWIIFWKNTSLDNLWKEHEHLTVTFLPVNKYRMLEVTWDGYACTTLWKKNLKDFESIEIDFYFKTVLWAWI